MKSIFGIWTAYFMVNALRAMLWGAPHHSHSLIAYLITAVISVTVTWALYRCLILVGDRTARAVLILTIPTIFLAIAIAYLTDLILAFPTPILAHISANHDLPLDMALSHFFDTAFVDYLILVGWGGLYLAMANSRKTQAALIHSRNLERVTRESEMRALRYQLNPHFVFNALNSVSSLIIDNKNSQAEHLVDGLADYMRSVLNDEDGDMITVEQEIAQQVRYLEIEQVRFPKRLSFNVHIDNDVRSWKIPALIIQPLVENAIKHGVARSCQPVSVTISARKDADRLKLVVTNDGGIEIGDAKTDGTGTGLSNIRERLAALYGPAAALLTHSENDEKMVATIIIPDEEQIFRDYCL
ncbi:sensor histidine kinase [Parasphingorhabdus cellanae]|uniref:Histidine kinase n=1 Tax=Parasphingorhabdus cellanae TaxID=2806553 RepID=A0ABX7T821_9SPHN|nr:histidine kinase [Parasphingorhabdus cellanae]QTD57236.1 histidine kinase [Parasphingorhabdus cellanae]